MDAPIGASHGQLGPLRAVSAETVCHSRATAHLGGFVGHRSRAACAKFLQLLSAQEEDVLLRQEVSTPKGCDGTQRPLWSRRTGEWESALWGASFRAVKATQACA